MNAIVNIADFRKVEASDLWLENDLYQVTFTTLAGGVLAIFAILAATAIIYLPGLVYGLYGLPVAVLGILLVTHARRLLAVRRAVRECFRARLFVPRGPTRKAELTVDVSQDAPLPEFVVHGMAEQRRLEDQAASLMKSFLPPFTLETSCTRAIAEANAALESLSVNSFYQMHLRKAKNHRSNPRFWPYVEAHSTFDRPIETYAPFNRSA